MVVVIPGHALVLLHGPGAALGWPKPLCPVDLEGQEDAGNSLGTGSSWYYLRQEHFDLKMSQRGAEAKGNKQSLGSFLQEAPPPPEEQPRQKPDPASL